MPDPNIGLTWNNLEGRLLQMMSMKHNQDKLDHQTPKEVARKTMANIGGGFEGVPQVEEFASPRRFLRAAGNFLYGKWGGWWFEEELLWRLENRLRAWPLPEEYRQNIIRWRLRNGLAVSQDWNPLSELWSLQLPVGERLTGLVGPTRRQPVYSKGHPDHDPAWILAGGERQIYFPVINPLWVWRYR